MEQERKVDIRWHQRDKDSEYFLSIYFMKLNHTRANTVDSTERLYKGVQNSAPPPKLSLAPAESSACL